MADGINSDEFFRIAALASVAPPEGELRTRNFRAARKVLGTYALQVVETARREGDTRSGDSSGETPPCPLRPDRPGHGLSEGAAIELAPEKGQRLIHVPRVLGGGSS